MKTIILNHVCQAQHGDLIRLVKAFDHSESDYKVPDHKHYPAGTYALVDLAQGDDLIRLDFDLPEWILDEHIPGVKSFNIETGRYTHTLRDYQNDLLKEDPMFPNQLTLQDSDFQVLTEFELIWSPEDPFSWYVNSYLVDLARGGPEEGGWYYNFGIPVESIGCLSHLAARLVQQSVDKRNQELNEDRPEISSVSSQGRYQSAVEKHMAKAWPETKPRYE